MPHANGFLPYACSAHRWQPRVWRDMVIEVSVYFLLCDVQSQHAISGGRSCQPSVTRDTNPVKYDSGSSCVRLAPPVGCMA